MRVLVVSQYFWPETFRINEVVLSLRDAGAEVTVLTGKPNYPEGSVFDGWRAGGVVRERWQGIDVLRVPMLPRGRANAVGLGLNYLSFAACGALLAPWLLRGRCFDVIFAYGNSPLTQVVPALALKALQRVPVALWVQDLWPQSLQATGFVRSRALLKAVERMVRLLYRGCDLLLVQSRAFVDEVARLADPRKVVYHPNPGELALRSREAPGEPPFVLAEAFNVVFAGNLGTAQAIPTIVEAAERLRARTDVRLVLVGAGSLGGWLREQVAQRGLVNVDLPGRFGPETMPAVYARASALLVTLAAEDAFRMTVPSKVQAYLAAGRPLVAALDGEGARVVEEAGAGLCVPAQDAAALAAAIERLADMPAPVRDAMGRRGRAYYLEHFEPERLARRLLELFAPLAGGRGATRDPAAAVRGDTPEAR